jgi:hypothetical protein
MLLATFRSRLMSTRAQDANQVQDEKEQDQRDSNDDPKR